MASHGFTGTDSAVVRASRKRSYSSLGEGAVDVVGGAFVVAGGEEDAVHVDGGGVDDGGDGVVEGEVVGAGETLQFGGKRGAGERAGGEDGERVGLVGVERGDLFAVDGDAWG